jgi:hypothetical protein
MEYSNLRINLYKLDYMNLTVIFIIILIILGTKFINYYHKFFYIYKQLDDSEKFKYFCNNTLIKLIGKNSRFKSLVIVYLLTPLIKINYMIISALIYLMYALCENEFDNILLNNGLDNQKLKMFELNNKEYELFNEEPVINFIENNKSTFSTTLKDDIDSFITNTEDKKTSHVILCNDETNLKINDFLGNTLPIVEKNGICLNDNLEDLDDYIINNNSINKGVIESNEQKEPIEMISMEEVDFGDYMINLINNSDKKSEKSEEIVINNKMEKDIPIKIKIGKKKSK